MITSTTDLQNITCPKRPFSCYRSVTKSNPVRNLRSNDKLNLSVPSGNLKTLGSFAFRGPSLWNSLLIYTKNSPSLSLFSSKLKTHLSPRYCWHWTDHGDLSDKMITVATASRGTQGCLYPKWCGHQLQTTVPTDKGKPHNTMEPLYCRRFAPSEIVWINKVSE